MTIEVKVPQLPESVADATLVAWHKSAGDAVARDENLVDLETDKVVLEVPAPANGVLKEIRIADGTTVTSGEVLAILEEGEAPPAAPAADRGRARLLRPQLVQPRKSLGSRRPHRPSRSPKQAARLPQNSALRCDVFLTNTVSMRNRSPGPRVMVA